MAISTVALPVVAGSSSLASVRAAKLSRQSASLGRLVQCNANSVGNDQQPESNKKSAPLRLSAVVVPMLAAAFVGELYASFAPICFLLFLLYFTLPRGP